MVTLAFIIIAFQDGSDLEGSKTLYPGQNYLTSGFDYRIRQASLKPEGRVLVVKPTDTAVRQERTAIGGEEADKKRWLSIQPVEVVSTGERVRLVIQLERSPNFPDRIVPEPVLDARRNYVVWTRPEIDRKLDVRGAVPMIYTSNQFAKESEQEVAVHMLMATNASAVDTNHPKPWKQFLRTMLAQPDGSDANITIQGCRLMTRFGWERNEPPLSSTHDDRADVREAVQELLWRAARGNSRLALHAALALSSIWSEGSFDRLWSLMEQWKEDESVLSDSMDFIALDRNVASSAAYRTKGTDPSNEQKLELAFSASNPAIRVWALSGLTKPTFDAQRRLLPLLNIDEFRLKWRIYECFAEWNSKPEKTPRVDSIGIGGGRGKDVVQNEAALRQFWTSFFE